MLLNSSLESNNNDWDPIEACVSGEAGRKPFCTETFRGDERSADQHGEGVRLVPWKLLDPFHWPGPSLVMVNRTLDLFAEEVPDAYIVSVFETMAAADFHVYAVLTKQLTRMRDLLNGPIEFAGGLPHIWFGASFEDRKLALHRVDLLRMCKVANRFLSCEPLLEDLGQVNLADISWVIAAGESIPGTNQESVNSLRHQCESAGVPFLLKQSGDIPRGKLVCELDNECRAYPALKSFRFPALVQRQRLEGEARKQLWAVGILENAA
jgi:protein gp37